MDDENVNERAMDLTPTRKGADETMKQLAHEVAEHQRVWGLVASLASLVENRDEQIALLEDLLIQMQPYSPAYVDDQNTRIHHLEGRIVKQKKAFNNLEECRRFEKETEQILADALKSIKTAPNKASMLVRANDALVELDDRKGPRPKAEDAS